MIIFVRMFKKRIKIKNTKGSVMIKLKLTAIVSAAGIFLSALTTPLMAFSVGAGGTFGGTYAEITGTETLRSSNVTQSATESTVGALASAYVQAIVGEDMFGEGNGFAIGYEHIFGEATFKGDTDNKSDIISTVGAVSDGVQHAEATLENLNTIFIETPGFTALGLYLKAGYSEMDVRTKEVLLTGGSYGDSSSSGEVYGFGFKKSAGGFQIKTEFNYTDWDQISVNNTSDSTGTSTVTGTPENWTGKISFGYNF